MFKDILLGLIAGVSISYGVYLLHMEKGENTSEKLQEHMKGNSIGNSQDVWVEKYNMMGEWERTILIFGYWDDMEVCSDFVKMYTEKYWRDKYRCVYN